MSHGDPDVLDIVWKQNSEIIEIKVWSGRSLQSNPDVLGCLIRVRVYKADALTPKFAQPFWLFWTGPQEMDWKTFWCVYLKRFCIESVHQFAKNSLAWTRPRLGYTEREEHWTQLVMLAYWQLLLGTELANDARAPWQKATPPDRRPTPGRVQRDYLRIFSLVGTPAADPKPRGISPGRPFGYRPTPRTRYRVVFKGSNTS
jgi:hypothetical protein